MFLKYVKENIISKPAWLSSLLVCRREKPLWRESAATDADSGQPC
jgi:hypothetical protein